MHAHFYAFEADRNLMVAIVPIHIVHCPRRGDVKEDMAFAFMKVITSLYIIVDMMAEVFIREKQTLRFVDA